MGACGNQCLIPLLNKNGESMIHKKILFTALLLLLTVGVVTAVPPLPCSYSGSVHIGGVPAPEGTVIETVVYTTIRDQVEHHYGVVLKPEPVLVGCRL